MQKLLLVWLLITSSMILSSNDISSEKHGTSNVTNQISLQPETHYYSESPHHQCTAQHKKQNQGLSYAKTALIGFASGVGLVLGLVIPGLF